MILSEEQITGLKLIPAILVLIYAIRLIYIMYQKDKELYKTRTNLFSQKETKKQIKHQQTLIAKMMKKWKKGK